MSFYCGVEFFTALFGLGWEYNVRLSAKLDHHTVTLALNIENIFNLIIYL